MKTASSFQFADGFWITGTSRNFLFQKTIFETETSCSLIPESKRMEIGTGGSLIPNYEKNRDEQLLFFKKTNTCPLPHTGKD